MDGCADEDSDSVISSVDVAICEAPVGVTVNVANNDPRRYQVEFNGGVACWATGTAGGVVSSGECSANLPDITTGLVSTSPISTLNMWGYNDVGQLGNGSSDIRLLPQEVTTSGLLAGKNITDVSFGSRHACAVADSEVYCWGFPGDGQLGLATVGPFVKVSY